MPPSIATKAPIPGDADYTFDWQRNFVRPAQSTSSFPSTLPNSSVGGEPSKGWSWFDSYDTESGQKTAGVVSTGTAVFGALASAYLGYQGLKLGKDQLKQDKKIFNLNFENQAQMTNTYLADRQRAAYNSGGGAVSGLDTVDEYMKKNAVKTKGV